MKSKGIYFIAFTYACGGVWKKVKSKEKFGRYIRVWRRKLGKNWEKTKKEKIYFIVWIYYFKE